MEKNEIVLKIQRLESIAELAAGRIRSGCKNDGCPWKEEGTLLVESLPQKVVINLLEKLYKKDKDKDFECSHDQINFGALEQASICAWRQQAYTKKMNHE